MPELNNTSQFVSAEELLANLRDKQIKLRTMQEMKVTEWYQKVSGLDPAILMDIKIPVNCTLRDLTPEIYKDEPDPDVYRAELEKANEMFAKVNEIAARYNKEALECLSKLQEIDSKQP